MSEDRFKQARRSLLDKQNQRQEGFDDEFEDEATSMVDLGSVRSGGHAAPGMHGAPAHGGYGRPAQDDATEMISVSAASASVGGSVRIPAAQAPSNRGPVVIGEAAGEGATAFIDISALAAGGPSSGAAEPPPSEGNTQFIDINQLQAGAGVQAQGTVDQDPVLRQSYAFGPESIVQGEFTLIFANDYTGRPVVLKRIWEGDVNTMPAELRQRVAMLDQIRHPRLIGLTGMFASPTGAWVELPRPAGYRLTDVLGGRGPQPADQVQKWMQQVAEVLSFVHQFQFVYANLTTDAIWIQDDGSVYVEPFDILTFENRGNLNVFGPPELNFPPQQRQVYPSTDVYSLGVATAAALTGLPVNLGAIPQLPKPFSDACMKAIQQNPAERIPTPADFATAISGGKTGKAGGAKGGGGKLDMKVVIGGVAAVGALTVGALFMMQGGGGGGGQQVTPPETVVSQGAAGQTAAQLPPLPEGLEAELDPRLQIESSIRFNSGAEGTVERDPDAAEKLRQEARAALTGIERLNDVGQRDKYSESLSKMIHAMRLSEMTDEDRSFLTSLFAAKPVQTMREQKLKEVQEAIQKGNVGTIKLVYNNLESMDPAASHAAFFNQNKTVKIRTIPRVGQEEAPTE